jgi:hypothetical protein
VLEEKERKEGRVLYAERRGAEGGRGHDSGGERICIVGHISSGLVDFWILQDNPIYGVLLDFFFMSTSSRALLILGAQAEIGRILF